MKKRIIALLLCACMISAYLAPIAPAVSAYSGTVQLLQGQEPVSALKLPVDEKTVLTANFDDAEEAQYQWQLLLNKEPEIWVNIYDKLEKECEVSYALVKNLLDETECAYLRCAVTSGETRFYSEPVCVSIVPAHEEVLKEEPMVLLTDIVVLEPEETEPTEATTMPTEAATEPTEPTTVPTEAATEPTEITTVPTEAVAEPTETTTVPTEAVTEPTEITTIPTEAVAEPTETTTVPTEAVAEPTETTTVPTEAATEPTEITTVPTEAATEPTETSTAPTEVATEPTEAATAPTEVSLVLGEVVTDPIVEEKNFVEALSAMFAVPASAAEVTETDVSGQAGTEYVTITIKYLDKSSLETGTESAIYSPYTATIASGTDFVQNVVSPTFLGFAPYYAADADNVVDDDASKIYLDLHNVTEDQVICVYYKPIKVNFAVRYFFQNIHDDQYTENVAMYVQDQAETGTIITDEYLRNAAGDTTGFEKLYHFPESVAADGSTVFECYYDRNYYLIQFDLNGGYGTEPIYARYGTPFVVNEPQRAGYIFAGWDLLADTDGDGTPETGDGTADTVPATIPAQNQYYRAIWTNENVDITIAYWLEDANVDGKYNYWGGRTVENAAKSGTTVNGETYKDYAEIADKLDTYEMRYSEYSHADTNVLVEGDGSTVVNVYYNRKEYTLRFYYAMSSGSGDAAKYYVIGGSTWYFGTLATVGDDDKGNEIILLGDYMSETRFDQRGEVDELPQLNDIGKSRGYTQGTETATVDVYWDGKEVVDFTYYYISFKAKYGADISQLWPCNVFNSVTRTTNNTYSNWSGTEAFVSAWNGEHHVYYTQHNENQTIKGNYNQLDYKLLWDYDQFNDSSTVAYLCFWENGADISWSVPELYRYNIYLQNLNGTGYDLTATYDTCDDSDVDHQTPPAITGFRYESYTSSSITEFDTNLYSEANNVNFYYSRESYALTLHNRGITIKEDQVPFEAPLDTYFQIPPYPESLEADAYEFAGWYTTEDCLPGSEFGTFVLNENGRYVSSNFSGETMPASKLILYAHWVPKVHTVNFFVDQDTMALYEGGDTTTRIHQTVNNIPHGTVIGQEITTPTKYQTVNGVDVALTFAGWFHIEGGQKKAFTPRDMPINRDMNIFADWSSSSPQPYRIQYVLKDNPTVKVADDTNGFAYGGSTRTFTAKAGEPFNQLYPAYNTGYFPIVSTHSITMQYEADKNNPTTNVYTFEYVQAQKIEYTVRYVNLETGEEVHETKTAATTSSVVTERFEAVADMVPDAFYKRLVLAVEVNEDGDVISSPNNVITFYYTENDKSAYYAVHYMLEKLDATEEQKKQYYIDGSGGYEESGTHEEGIGDVDSTISVTPQTFSGFELISDKGIEVQSGTEDAAAYANGQYSITITQAGTELYIFYARRQYNYTVHYYLYNTTTPVDEDKYPSVTEIASYGSQVTKTAPTIDGHTCVSQTEQSITIRENEAQNVIIFYYSPTQYTAEYVPVTPDGGSVSRTLEVKSGTEDFEGSVPTPNTYYRFDGWYLDEACTQKADGYGTVNESGAFVPNKEKLSATDRNIFYAKFVRKVGDLTIQRTGAKEEDQVFVYDVTNNETGEVITVTVTGNGSTTIHDLPQGMYTVTQKNDWSWRYNDAEQYVDHSGTDGVGTTVQFGKMMGSDQWLNGNSSVVVNRKGAQG